MNKESQTLRVLYKNLFSRLKDLLISPSKAWSNILPEQHQVNDVLAQFSLPLIGAYTISAFIGFLMNHQGWSFDLALRDAVFTFSSCFFGLYIGWFLLTKILPSVGLNTSKETVFKLIAYPSVTIYLIGFLTNLVPQIFFFVFIQLYAGYIVWEGLRELNQSDNDSRIIQTIIITFTLLFLPFALGELLFRLSPI